MFEANSAFFAVTLIVSMDLQLKGLLASTKLVSNAVTPLEQTHTDWLSFCSHALSKMEMGKGFPAQKTLFSTY